MRIQHIRLKPFGAMHRHHANGVILAIHLAFDLAGRPVKPGDEITQAARRAVFKIKRLPQ